jgi:hypothetical protein
MMLFAHGFVFAAFMIIGLVFYKYYIRTKDRFFLMFSASFLLLAIERVVIALMNANDAEAGPSVYLIRLLSFSVIIAAILDKNRAEKAEEKPKESERFVN